MTTQLFFAGGDYLDTDAGNAVKPDLIIPLSTSPERGNDAGSPRTHRASYDFALEPQG